MSSSTASRSSRRDARCAMLSQRLAESYEAALRIADGRALAVEIDAASANRPRQGAPVEHLFSSKFSCPLCDYSLPELEPRLFSFNSPVGACPTCGGLGVTTVFDADRVVAFPSLSLASGAVKGWDRRNAYTFSLLESVAAPLRLRHRHRRSRSCRSRPARCCCAARAATRSSSSTRPKGRAARPAQVKRKHPFEGILPNLERRFKRDRLGGGARGPDALPERQALPRLPRRAPAGRGEQRLPGRCRQRRARADLPHRALHAAREPRLVPGARARRAPRPRSPTR